MTTEERIELAQKISNACDCGYVNVYEIAEMLSRLVGGKREAHCNCSSVAGRFCREAQSILADLTKK